MKQNMTRRFFMQLVAAFGFSTQVEAELPPPADCCVLCGYTKHLKSWQSGHGYRWDSKREAFFPVKSKRVPVPGDPLRCADHGGCQARQMNTYVGTQTNWQRDGG